MNSPTVNHKKPSRFPFFPCAESEMELMEDDLTEISKETGKMQQVVTKMDEAVGTFEVVMGHAPTNPGQAP